MRLVQLIYASSLVKPEDSHNLDTLVAKASDYNREKSITGMLVFGNDCFLQCLEGGREAVNELYVKISYDERHKHIVLLNYSEISERAFHKWSMKLMMMTKEKMKEILRFHIEPEFDPYKMSCESALKLLLSLKE